MKNNNYLIMVNVSSTGGSITYKLATYPDNKKVPDPMRVAPGDRLAWHVQVGIGGAPFPLPYTISFFEPDGKTPDAQFFGVSSVSVPTGGTSPSLHVRSLQSTIKYSVTVPGMGVIFDPVIQTGDGMTPDIMDVADGDSYAVTWDIDGKTVVYAKNGEDEEPFPARLPIKYGDTMGFNATSRTPGTGIQVVFTWDGVTNWVSPFLQATGTMPTPPANPIAPITVKDPGDLYSAQHGVFPFYLKTADGNRSSSFNLSLA